MSNENKYPYLERNSRGSTRAPHRLQMDGWWTAVDDAAAAVFERGLSEPLPTMTGHEMANALESGQEVEYQRANDGWITSTRTYAPFWRRVAHARVVARVAGDPEPAPAPEAPVDPLPEGVHAAPDGTLLCRGRDVPSGPWERRCLTYDYGWASCEHLEAGGVDAEFQDRWYEVRPVPPEPETERVRWQDAIGRTLPDGREITGALPGTETPGTLFVDDGAGYAIVGATSDSDGRVSVLPLSENTEEG